MFFGKAFGGVVGVVGVGELAVQAWRLVVAFAKKARRTKRLDADAGQEADDIEEGE